MKKRIKLHEATHENDIRYRGPLSYQHFMALGWLCLAVSQMIVVMKLGGRINPQVSTDTAGILPVLEEIANFALPFLLIANFAQILDAKNGYKKQLVKNIGAMAAICGLFYLFYYRYVVGGFAAFLKDPGQALPAIESLLGKALPFGFRAFNVFVDLLLCTLVMLFLNYRPTRVFKGKLVVIFRLFAILPIAYEVCCMLLKIRSAEGLVRLPAWTYPLLTVKPPMTFVLFVIMAIFVKTRELRFRRHGKTHEDYQAFLKTRRNSWNFSVFLAIMMVVVSVIDFSVVLGFTLGEGMKSFSARDGAAQIQADGEAPAVADGVETATEAPVLSDGAETVAENTDAEGAVSGETDVAADLDAYFSSEEGDAALERGVRIALAVGFGESIYMAFLAPLVLLFSYSRIPKRKWIDMLIPATGVILILAIYIEGVHRLLYCLPIEKMDLEEIKQTAELYSAMLK